MASVGKLTVKLALSVEDVLRLIAYREVLREIARGQPFDPAAQIAREVLEHFGEGDAD